MTKTTMDKFVEQQTRANPVLRFWSQHEPAPAEDAMRRYIEAMLAAAACDLDTFQAALDRYLLDGNFGPISDEDWAEQDGRPVTRAQAVRILNDAMQVGFGDHEFYNPEAESAGLACATCQVPAVPKEGAEEWPRAACPTCGSSDDLVEVPNARLVGEGVRRAFWAGVRAITGRMAAV